MFRMASNESVEREGLLGYIINSLVSGIETPIPYKRTDSNTERGRISEEEWRHRWHSMGGDACYRRWWWTWAR